MTYKQFLKKRKNQLRRRNSKKHMGVFASTIFDRKDYFNATMKPAPSKSRNKSKPKQPNTARKNNQMIF